MTARAVAPPPTLLPERVRVDRAVLAFLDSRAGRFADPPELAQVYRMVRDFVLRGGKRLRPLFCYWGWRGAGGYQDEQLVAEVAASVEIFHAFALIHDDIMDASDRRRSRPSMHRALAQLHNLHGWRGSTGHFGLALAILSGDLCLTWSDELLHGCRLPTDRARAVTGLVNQMRSEVMIGQYLDLLNQAGGATLAESMRTIRYKTAKYTVERPLHIGATLAGADPRVLAAYTDLGVPLGEAYQLRDDLLGVFGDSTVTGKSTVDDLRAGKPTVLIALARERATGPQGALINDLHGNPALDDSGAAVLRGVIAATGARDRIETMIADRAEKALHALDAAPIAEDARAALRDLTHAATERDT